MVGKTMDLAEPDLEMVDVRAATRHSGLEGFFFDALVSQSNLHLNKFSEELTAL